MADASLAGDHFYVYVHRRLSTGEPFYVGKGAGQRAYMFKGRNEHWNRIVSKDGGRNLTFVARGLDEELAFFAEVELIEKYRRMGVALCNSTDGGDGCSGYKWPPNRKPNPKRTAEQIERIAALQRGKKRGPLSEECKRNLSLSIKAAWANGDRKRKQPKVKKPLKHTEEFKAAMSVRMTGNKFRQYKPGEPPRHQSPEHVANRMASGERKYREYHDRRRAEKIARQK